MPNIPYLIKQSLVISEPMITDGKDVFIACDTLEFTGNGVINTGFSIPQVNSGDGAKSGNITIVARHIRSLKLITQGQTGGVGAPGDTGTSGVKGAPGTNGKDAECGGLSGKKAGDGGKGGKGGQGWDGHPGHQGGQGGNSGSVSIHYFESDISLDTPGNFINLVGGQGGKGGPGGEPGEGGEGGDGGVGGYGASCERSTKNGDITYELDPGKDGEPGDIGDRGKNSGAEGPPGKPGEPGRYIAIKYNNEDEFRAEIKPYIPAIGSSSAERGEKLYMLNRFKEARELFNAALRNKADRDGNAAILLKRMDEGENYFNHRLEWAPLLTREKGTVHLLREVEDIADELERDRVLLNEASKVTEYRSKDVFENENAINAFEFEKSKLDYILIGVRKSLENVEGDLEAVRDRISALETQTQELKNRIEKLFQELKNLPENVVQKGKDIISSLTQFGAFLAGAYGAANTGNWPGVTAAMLGAIGSLQSGINATQSLLDVGVNLKGQIDRARDELYKTRDMIQNAQNEIRQILSRQEEDSQRVIHLDQTRSMLGTYQQNRDLESLRILKIQSEQVLWQVRKMVAERMYVHRRYLDLRMGRADAIMPMNPPDGVDSAFSYLHLLSILSDIQHSSLSDEQPEITSWDIMFKAEDFPSCFRDLCDRKMANFTVTDTDLPDFLRPSRVRSVSVRFFDDIDALMPGYYLLSQGWGEAYSLTGGLKYELEEVSWLFRLKGSETIPLSDAKFAFRNPASVWTLQVKDLKGYPVDPTTMPIKKVQFEFELETLSPEARKRIGNMAIAEQQDVGTSTSVESRMRSIRLDGLSE